MNWCASAATQEVSTEVVGFVRLTVPAASSGTTGDATAANPFYAVADFRNGIANAPYNETFVQTFNGSGNFDTEAAMAPFTQVTAIMIHAAA